MPFASVEALTVRHIGRRAPALRDLDLRWEDGERLLLLGPSGSGKSTLALCLDGVIPHALDAHWEAGRVSVRGRDTRATRHADIVRDVGVLFQDPESQLVMLEVDDEIAFGLENLGIARNEMCGRVAAARTAVGLPPDARFLARLSGGTKQRVALASILALRQRGIVLDEPTAMLDPVGVREVLGAFAGLAADRARSLLLIEHRVDELLRHIDRVVVLDADGRHALSGDPDDVFIRQTERIDALGVWEPELAALARATDAPRVPRSTDEAMPLVLGRTWRPLPPPPERRSATPLIEAHAVRYRYPRSLSDAVTDVDVRMGPGDCVAIVGPNGAGKTTLGLLLAGILTPTAGRIAMPERATPPAYVFQYPEHQFVASSAREDILFSLRSRGIDGTMATRRANELLERFGLAALAEANPYSLSHGEKRRLSVATALAIEPRVLMLDEPTFGQDRRNTATMGDLVDERAGSGAAVVLITHDLPFVAAHATRVVAMADGRIVFEGTTRELFARPDVLARCRLELPPLAAAFHAARASGADVPAVASRVDLDWAAAPAAVHA